MKYKVINSFKTYSYVLIEAENEKQAKIKAKTEPLEWLDLKGVEKSKIESVERIKI